MIRKAARHVNLTNRGRIIAIYSRCFVRVEDILVDNKA
jgi:hypothetical protein